MDYFALLGQPRRPWLEADELKSRFLALSVEAHPDRAHGAGAAEKEAANAHYTVLHAAYQCLRQPKDRLAHLLELETGRRPADVQEGGGVPDLFFQMAPVFHAVDKFLREKTATASPLLKAQQFTTGMDWTEKLMELQRQITLRRQNLEAELRAMNAAWTSAPPLARVESLYREFSFLKRWSEQAQERIARLALE